MTLTIEEVSAQLASVLASLNSSSETAADNTASCQELRVTTERMLKSQDNLTNKVDAVENQLLRMGTRLTSIESTINTVLGTSSSPDGQGEELEHQGIASERALVNGTFHTARTQFGPSSSHAPFENIRGGRDTART
jgi:phage shock protein A